MDSFVPDLKENPMVVVKGLLKKYCLVVNPEELPNKDRPLAVVPACTMIYSACACGGNTSVRGLEVYRCGYILGSGIRDGLVSARACVCVCVCVCM